MLFVFVWSFRLYDIFEKILVKYFYFKFVFDNFKIMGFGIYICIVINFVRLKYLNVFFFVFLYIKYLGSNYNGCKKKVDIFKFVSDIIEILCVLLMFGL